jgi:DNA repair exonuclease SbcCD ATPase subunit
LRPQHRRSPTESPPNAEADKIEDRLEELKGVVNTKQNRLNDIERENEKVQMIHGVLNLEKKKQIIEQIQESREYQELDKLRDGAAGLVDDLEAIREAISQVAKDEAHQQLTAAKDAINKSFSQLTRNPAVCGIKLDVSTDSRTQRNDYTITGQDGQDLPSLLSQGDLNTLSLAIFLGLAASAKDSGVFGFVLMDDPSQSLDAEHKKRLVEVLNDIARQKQLVLATMDQEFRDYLDKKLTRMKTEYRYGKWTPDQGPAITRM